MQEKKQQADELKVRLDKVIQKSRAQKKILKKILDHFNNQGFDQGESLTEKGKQTGEGNKNNKEFQSD